MYSEKVLEHFKHPHNAGEMTDPDAVGNLGNPTCLFPYEKVYSDASLVPISQIHIGDHVMGFDGQSDLVRGVFSRRYSGKIITLKNKLGEVSLTPEHIVYAIKLPKQSKYARTKNKKQLTPAWYHASSLEKGDIAIYPFDTSVIDKSYVETEVIKKKWDFKSNPIPSRINISPDFLRLVGYFLAEGNIQDRPSKTYISFSFHIKEVNLANDVRTLVKDIFGLETKEKLRPSSNGRIVYIYNAHVARFFKSLFGNGAEHKRIPYFMMKLPILKQVQLIVGLWRGDGYVNTARIGSRAGYATVSYHLAQQIKVLLLRQGIIPSIYSEKSKMVKGVQHRHNFRIHVGQRESLQKLCKLLLEKYLPSSYSIVDSWIEGGRLFTPITNVSYVKYTGLVFNLEVMNTHSFTTPAFCLHNCGDMMTIYIKVDPTTKKLTDVKFQTFGCAAAIATSSMVTDLAKGKTLDEAERITNKDVAEALGNLPAIKMHCSNLAADALREAIKNYRGKHRH